MWLCEGCQAINTAQRGAAGYAHLVEIAHIFEKNPTGLARIAIRRFCCPECNARWTCEDSPAQTVERSRPTETTRMTFA
jgi:hypothetical protein